MDTSMPWRQYFSLLREHGKICLVGLPETSDLSNIPQFQLVMKNISLSGSTIGSPADIRRMLEFAVEHNVRPWIEKHPMSRVNEALGRLRDGKVRYRFVLENDSVKPM